VWAVEEGPIVEVAREVVRANGCADKVRFLRGRSTEISPPERARVVIFEDYRLSLTTRATVEVVRDLRDRWLAPGGVILPGRARQLVALVEDPEGRAQLDRFADRGERVCGVSLEPTRKRAFAEPCSRRLKGEALLAPPLLVRDVAVEEAEVAFSVDGEAVVTRDGEVHGLLLWLELELAGQWHSNAPGAPSSAWAPMELALDPAVPVRAGDRVGIKLEAAPFGEDLVYRWSIEHGGRRISAHSLDSLPLETTPPPGARVTVEAVAMDRSILESVDGTRTFSQISDEVCRRFPAVSRDKVTERVTTLLGRYVKR
jgi:hypothetical protein